MHVNIQFLMNTVVNNQLGMNLVDICLGNAQHICCKLLNISEDFRN